MLYVFLARVEVNCRAAVQVREISVDFFFFLEKAQSGRRDKYEGGGGPEGWALAVDTVARHSRWRCG